VKYYNFCGLTGRITAREAQGGRKLLLQCRLPANEPGTDSQFSSTILCLQTWKDVTETANYMIPQIGNNTAEFSSFINNNYIYVDKTKSIFELLTDHRRHLFLSRPRRFGKTLLIDTLEEVLTGRKELFSGMTIHNLWKESEWPQSHVLRISMNSFTDNPSTLDESLTFFMHSFAKRRGIEPGGTNCADSLVHSLTNLYDNYKNIPIITDHISADENKTAKTQKINILIDEYDAPVINNFTSATKRDIAKNTLHGFYNALKSCENLTDRIFITGITKFTQLSVFSALNNLDDISFDDKYCTICGFTFEEIKKFYGHHLELTLKAFRKKDQFGPTFTYDMFMKRIKDWYDGYSWNGNDQVINPISLQKLFSERKFKNHWIQTGGSNFLDQMNIENDIFKKVFNGKPTFNGSVDIQDAAKVDPIALMLQSGYLTVRKQQITDGISRLYLTVPNKEVGMTIMNNYVDSRVAPIIEHTVDTFNNKTCSKFSEAFFKRQSSEAELLLHSMLSAVPYSLHLPFESFYHSLIFSIFRSANVDVLPEVSKAKGIIDLVITSPDYGIMVTEIKYAKSVVKITEESDLNNKKIVAKITEKDNRQLKSCIHDAFKQILDNEYLSPYRGSEIPIYAVAIAVCGRSHVKIRSYPSEELLNKPSLYLTDKTLDSAVQSQVNNNSKEKKTATKSSNRKRYP
jgi:hypothetical protein